MNYIKKLQTENEDLKEQLQKTNEFAMELLKYASSEKFDGDWENRKESYIEDQMIHKMDVINRIQLVLNEIKI